MIKYRIKNKVIHYNCPACNGPLESKIDEVKSLDRCPLCGAGFIVPGPDLNKSNPPPPPPPKRTDEIPLSTEPTPSLKLPKLPKLFPLVTSIKTVYGSERMNSTDNVPTYWAIRTVGNVCVIFGILSIILGVILPLAGVGCTEREYVMFSAGVLLFSFFVFWGIGLIAAGQLMLAFRDVAINSWLILSSVEGKNKKIS